MSSRLDRLVALLASASATTDARSSAARQLGDIQARQPASLHGLLHRLLPLLDDASWDTRTAAAAAVGHVLDHDVAFIVRHGRPLAGSSLKPQQRGMSAEDHLLWTLGRHPQSASPQPPPTSATMTPKAAQVASDAGSDVAAMRALHADWDSMSAWARKKHLRQYRNSRSESRKRARPQGDEEAPPQGGKHDARNAPLPSQHRSKKLVAAAVDTAATSSTLETSGTAADWALAPTPQASQADIEVPPDHVWPLQAFATHVLGRMFAPAWCMRHGAMLALRALLQRHAPGLGLTRQQQPDQVIALEHAVAVDNVVARLLLLLMQERVSDWVGDRMVSPVRELTAQCLALLVPRLSHAHLTAVARVLSHMLALQQDWAVRHAALVALKYVVGAHAERFGAAVGLHALVPLLQAALQDSDEEVVGAAADSLGPLVEHVLQLPHHSSDHDGGEPVTHVLGSTAARLWHALARLDALSSATASVMCLLARIHEVASGAGLLEPVLRHATACAKGSDARKPAPSPASTEATSVVVTHFVPRLYAHFRHGVASVRSAVLVTLQAVIAPLGQGEGLGTKEAIACLGSVFRLLYQNMWLEPDAHVLQATLRAWRAVVAAASSDALCAAVAPLLSEWSALLSVPSGQALPPSLFPRVAGAIDGDVSKAVNRDCATLSARLVAAAAWGAVLTAWPVADVVRPLTPLAQAVASQWSTHRAAAAWVLAEWTRAPGSQATAACPGQLIALLQALLPRSDSVAVPTDTDTALVRCAVAEALVGLQHGDSVNVVVHDALVAALGSVPLDLVQRRAARSWASLCLEHGEEQLSWVQQRAFAQLWAWLCQPGEDVRAWESGAGASASEPPDLVTAAISGNVIGVNDGVSVVGVSPAGNGVSVAPPDHERAVPSSSCIGMIPSIRCRGASWALTALARQAGNAVWQRLPWLLRRVDTCLRPDAAAGEVGEASRADTQPSVVEQLRAMAALRSLASGATPVASEALLRLLPCVFPLLGHERARCHSAIATCVALCDCLGTPALRLVTEDALPLAARGDASPELRAGAAELARQLVTQLDVTCVPWLPLMVQPVLASMSDVSESVRQAAVAAFARFVLLMPLEAGAEEPSDWDPVLSQRRLRARASFLSPLLGDAPIPSLQLPVPLPQGIQLRPYQKAGVSWLAFLRRFGLHGILADDMGLGKTLQTLCIVATHYHSGNGDDGQAQPAGSDLPSLIVCPSTLVDHWAHEAVRWFPSHLRVIDVACGAPANGRGAVCILSYSQVSHGRVPWLRKQSFAYCVLDEGHVIKNARTKLATALHMVQARHRLILTGTPIQNNVLELWSLFHFLMPGLLGTEAAFRARYAKPIKASRKAKDGSAEQQRGTRALVALHRQVLPFVLRRLKEDVLDDLPPKVIQDTYCALSPIQARMWKALETWMRCHKGASGDPSSERVQQAGEVGEEALDGDSPSVSLQAFSWMRKLCVHPQLLLQDAGAPEEVKRMAGDSISGDGGGQGEAVALQHSGKLLALKELLEECGCGGVVAQHRVLIFAQLKATLDWIEKLVLKQHMPSVSFLRLDGDVAVRDRFAICRRFNEDPTVDVLLLTTKVGGVGLNLTGADTVIFVEHDWNPTADLQAMDRAHRLGQTRTVHVYRIIVRNTLEERIMSLQAWKRGLAGAVVNDKNASLHSMHSSSTPLVELLQDGAREPDGTSEGDTTSGGGDADYRDYSLHAFMSTQ